MRPSVANGKVIAVLAEEWHTAEAACRLSEQLTNRGLRGHVVIFWNANCDVINVRFHHQYELSRTLYNAPDAELANSSHEPFGLEGLEVMASGGLVFAGGTGEDYAQHFSNSIVLDVNDTQEITRYLDYLALNRGVATRLREAGRTTAHQFTWPSVIDELTERLESRTRARQALANLFDIVVQSAHKPSTLDAISIGGTVVHPGLKHNG